MVSPTLGAGPALVTGASRGIGRAIALKLAELGVRVVLLARNESELKAVAQEIEQSGGSADFYPLDLSDLNSLTDKLATVIEKNGPFQMLINNAGMGYTADIVDTPMQDWQRVIDLNLTAAFVCIKAVLPGMRQIQAGQIVNILSIASKQAFPGWGAYCASKFGLMGLTKALAQEVSKDCIRVTAYCPGAVNTPLWDTNTVQADFDRSKMLDADTVAQAPRASSVPSLQCGNR